VAVSRRSFLLKSTMGAAAITSGFFNPLDLKASTVKSHASKFLSGVSDNDAMQPTIIIWG